jgi:hypothetical protein
MTGITLARKQQLSLANPLFCAVFTIELQLLNPMQ